MDLVTVHNRLKSFEQTSFIITTYHYHYYFSFCVNASPYGFSMVNIYHHNMALKSNIISHKKKAAMCTYTAAFYRLLSVKAVFSGVYIPQLIAVLLQYVSGEVWPGSVLVSVLSARSQGSRASPCSYFLTLQGQEVLEFLGGDELLQHLFLVGCLAPLSPWHLKSNLRTKNL